MKEKGGEGGEREGNATDQEVKEGEYRQTRYMCREHYRSAIKEYSKIHSK